MTDLDEDDLGAQRSAPYLDALVAYGFRGPARFHVPGHKGGPGADPALRKAIGVDALAADVPQDIHGIDLGSVPTPYERAERLAAAAYGADRSFFLTNGATQGNHALCLALAPEGTHVIAQRNSHASVIDGLVLSGGSPTFVRPEYDAELGIAHCVTPEALAAALEADPEATAVFVVSPTYYGMTADIAGLAEVAHAADVALVVDQSWGPHFGFHPDLPATALSQGADAMLTSTHKIAGSLTQSAILHIAGSGRIDTAAVARVLRLLRSTSPSSLLIASLDSARRQLAMHGEQLLHETLQALDVARAKLRTIDGIELLDERHVGSKGIAAYDPMRIVLDVRATGCTGVELAAELRRTYDVHVELALQTTIVLIVGLGETQSALLRVAGDIEETVARLRRPEPVSVLDGTFTADLPPMPVTPRTAFLSDGIRVPVDEAVGRISCESIAAYPPGVPSLLPGELISQAMVAHLRSLVASGARLHGASDPAFETVTVMRLT
ncbi:aminotransferase class I/II-fold pyridoxal phosphate-dependent enzyme [Naasia lichenicola]|uniref:Aminotransferase class I/II-fold pyridoxal phosphate-dependent enzyme n=1 Tax=Naasia lichenicola TaxID=2565933 RepID=A0A4S4FQR3_9MICO|nr:aminotransferase class I/II-fold pyridoxal phosphate-dependent enzyme [Naasia lichenicola]THG32919.1 aminotransferase class I/II-fold pyridoxal phosphate-dependent enzyme [Naasia lichenicola]